MSKYAEFPFGSTDPGSGVPTTTASFTQPAVSATVTVAVTDTTGMASPMRIRVGGGGVYTVSSVTDASHVVLRNLGGGGNASPGATVGGAGGSAVAVSYEPPADYAYGCFSPRRNGVWYDDESGIGSVGMQTAGPTLYRVKDRDGAIVSSGSIAAVSPSSVVAAGGWPASVVKTFTPAAPGGSWLDGFYFGELLRSGADDPKWGPSCGSWNFAVIRRNASFPTLPATTGWTIYNGPVPDGASGGSSVLSIGDDVDVITRACLGMAVSRFSIVDPVNGVTSPDDGLTTALAGISTVKTWWLDHADGVRPREAWVNFPGQPYWGSWDMINLPTLTGTYQTYIYVLPKTTALVPNADKIFVEVLAGGGTAGSDKINVYYPNNTTLAESYDNLTTQTAAASAIRATSNLLWAAEGDLGFDRAGALTKVAIGNARYTTTKTCVQQLYAAGATRFEGPTNEPSSGGDFLARAYVAFQKAVHDGNAGAIAMGPCMVNISDTGAWNSFFTALSNIGGTIDALSFHDYNTVVNGDLNVARATIEAFLQVVKNHGLEGIEMWQTEATTGGQGVMVPQGVYHRRRDRITMAAVAVWEQYGIPHERNPYWYDVEHGFWAFPGNLFASSYQYPLNPVIVPWCVMAQEVRGKKFHHRIDFNHVVANKIFLGSIFGNPITGSVAQLLTMSHIPGAYVTFTVTGTSAALTVVDGQGRSSSIAQVSGTVKVPVSDIGSYVRLPAGVYLRVYEVGSGAGGLGNTPPPSINGAKIAANFGGEANPSVADDTWMSYFTGDSGSTGLNFSSIGIPDTVEVIYNQDVVVKHFFVHAGPYWQSATAPQAYVAETYDGSSWTARNVIDPADGVSKSSIDHSETTYLFGNTSVGSGCQLVTHAKEQWIEHVVFAAPQTCKGVRIRVTKASYGGEPDLQGMTVNGLLISQHGGQDGDVVVDPPRLSIQEISVLSATVPTLPGDWATEVAADNPIAWYRMEELSGFVMASAVNHPTLDGVYPASRSLGLPGAVGHAATFNNDPSGAQLPADASFDFGDVFTFEAVVKLNAPTIGVRDIIGWQAGLATLRIGNWGGPNGTTMKLAVIGGGSDGQVVASTTVNVPLGSFAHVAATKNGATTKLYINAIDDTVAGSNYTFPAAGHAVTGEIGTNMGSELIDEAVIYGTALSAARIQAHFQAMLKPSLPVNVRPAKIQGAS